MGFIDYSREPRSDIAFIDMKSFYASVECIERGLNPLRTSLCVMSRGENSNGLILASSPMFKQVFGRKNVGRAYDLPFDLKTRRLTHQFLSGHTLSQKECDLLELWAKRTLIVAPRMDLYIKKNLEIQTIFQDYASVKDILPYSIDEGFIDLTSSLNYFYDNPKVNRKQKLSAIVERIQNDIFQKTGIYAAAGLSNANPLLAKLALDNEAKKTPKLQANWSYEDVETKVWSIKSLTDFWGIGKAMEKRLQKMGIYSIRELANSNPDNLKKEFGIMGVQLWFHANGVDESNVHKPYKTHSKGIGNSQILPRDYVKQSEIELVLSEMAEQVAIRLRRLKKQTCNISIYIGYSKTESGKQPIRAQMKLEPTHLTDTLIDKALFLFRQKYSGGAVRQIAVRYSHFVDENYKLISLFKDVEKTEKIENLQGAIDAVRDQFGYLSLQKANVLLEGSRRIERSKLIGGHSAGGLDGLK